MPTAPSRKSGRQGPVKKMNLKQVTRMLLDYEAGDSMAALSRSYGVSAPTIAYWRTYAGLDEAWLRRVRELERANWILGKKARRATDSLKAATAIIKRLEPSPKRRATYSAALQANFSIPRQQANQVVGLSRSTGHVSKAQEGDHELVALMRRYLDENPGVGFRGMFEIILRSKGCLRSHAKRTYQQARLQRHWRKKPVPVPARIVRRIIPVVKRDQVWSMDFLIEVLPSGKRYQVLSALDNFSRECVLCLALSTATAKATVDALEALRKAHRIARSIHTDNGGQFKSLLYQQWTDLHHVRRIYSRPWRPTDNAYAERFNRTLRQEVLDWHEFKSLAEVQRMLDDWRVRYNMARPHMSLHGLSPLQFAAIYS